MLVLVSAEHILLFYSNPLSVRRLTETSFERIVKAKNLCFKDMMMTRSGEECTGKQGFVCPCGDDGDDDDDDESEQKESVREKEERSILINHD